MSFERTFEFRANHALPDRVPQPPANWQAPYAGLTESNDLACRTTDESHPAARTFVGRVLEESKPDALWSPADWHWLGGT